MSRSGKPVIIGWLLNEAQRQELLIRFPPAYPDIVAHHVTLAFGVSAAVPLPQEREGEIVGLADDGEGVQALVMRIKGTTDRPDGSTYHITWSLDRKRGRRPLESNDLIARCGWISVEPVTVWLRPARF